MYHLRIVCPVSPSGNLSCCLRCHTWGNSSSQRTWADLPGSAAGTRQAIFLFAIDDLAGLGTNGKTSWAALIVRWCVRGSRDQRTLLSAILSIRLESIYVALFLLEWLGGASSDVGNITCELAKWLWEISLIVLARWLSASSTSPRFLGCIFLFADLLLLSGLASTSSSRFALLISTWPYFLYRWFCFLAVILLLCIHGVPMHFLLPLSAWPISLRCRLERCSSMTL